MSVFLTPQGEPFFGGTYFPPVRRYNMPAFKEVLLSVAEAWEKERQQILESGKNLSAHLRQSLYPTTQDGAENLRPQVLEQAAATLAQNYDWDNGGWGQAPKFPQPMAIEFLLSRAVSGDKKSLDIAVHALQSMARGGMYDVVGGGFARYSTDDQWLVPHFEKMLYDNAQLARAYLHGFLVSGNPLFRRICTETLDFVQRELSDPQGGFFSSLDADSEGDEGKFYLWTHQEIQDALGDSKMASLFLEAYGVSQEGNFEGRNILQRAVDDAALGQRFNLELSQVQKWLDECHQRLLGWRTRRVRPATDDKVLVSWNALMLLAFAEAGRYLERNDYTETARRNARFLLSQLVQTKEKEMPDVSDEIREIHLYRSWRQGRAQHNAYLEDYASLVLGLIGLYQCDPDPGWYTTARDLTETLVSGFNDPQGGFFDTRDDHETLFLRPKDTQDNATPSGGALASLALLQMAALSGLGDWRDKAESALYMMQDSMDQYPTAYAFWLSALSFAIGPVDEIAILGDPNDEQMKALLQEVKKDFHPNRIVASSSFPPPQGTPELLHNRPLVNGKPSAYACRNFICKRPVNTADELIQQLDSGLDV